MIAAAGVCCRMPGARGGCRRRLGASLAARRVASHVGRYAAPCVRGAGCERLRRQVTVAARENDALRPDSPARLLLSAVGRLGPQPGLVRAVGQAMDEEGHIQVRGRGGRVGWDETRAVRACVRAGVRACGRAGVRAGLWRERQAHGP
jgi:hypothetical protein